MERNNGCFAAATHFDTSYYYTIESYQNVVVELFSSSNKSNKFNVSVIEYTPLLFGSLYTQTPREEFIMLGDALIYEGRKIDDNFVSLALNRWGLGSVADSKFHELSGGYKKLALIAMQIEARKPNDNVVAINIQHQLDVTRFRKVEAQLKEKGVRYVLWVDDDPNLLIRKSSVSPIQTSLKEWLAMTN